MSRRLNILHLTAGSDAGGVSQYLSDLCSALHADGHHIAIAGEHGAWHRLFQDAAFPWIQAPLKGSPIALWRAAGVLRRWLIDYPVDIIHTHYRKPTLVARYLQRAMRRVGQPAPRILYTLHLSDISLAWPRRWLTDFGDHTHAPSIEARDWLRLEGRVSEERITTIPHGVRPERFPSVTPDLRCAARGTFGLSPSTRVATYVGRLDDPKNVDWLIDLAIHAKQRLANLFMLVAGEGPHEAALRARIEHEAIAHSVRLLGHREPLAVYHAADAVLLPSAREGFSLMTAEAMCAGVPVFRTRTAGARELIIEGVTGKTCAVDRDAFVSGALDFLSDADALSQMGKAAAEHVRTRFTFEQQVRRTVELYDCLTIAK